MRGALAGQEGLDLTLGVGKPLSGQGGLHGLYRPDLEVLGPTFDTYILGTASPSSC